MKTYEIVFSPTGRTEKAAHAIAEAFGREVELIDLADKDLDIGEFSITAEDISVIAAPVYGGRIPGIAAERLAKVKGAGPAVLVAVFGNRAVDDALLEMQDIAEGCGFNVVAGIEAVAEHSVVREFGKDRPNDDDIAELQRFAYQIKSALEWGAAKTPELPGNRPFKEFKGASAKPELITSDCMLCGLCSMTCPVGAIPKDAPDTIHLDQCIGCMRCIAICLTHARSLSDETKQKYHQRLEAVCAEPKQNKLYM